MRASKDRRVLGQFGTPAAVYVAGLVLMLGGAIGGPSIARADYLEYRLPGTRYALILRGDVTITSSVSATLRHPRFGTAVFTRSEVTIHRGPSPVTMARYAMTKAETERTVDAFLAAARTALGLGQLDACKKACDRAAAIDARDPRVALIQSLRRRMAQPIADSNALADRIKKLVNRQDMKIATSEHFVILHDTPDRPTPPSRIPRAQDRLTLLEVVYESFLLHFALEGIELRVPKDRLGVVLFNEHQDYLDFATKLSPSLASSSGFYDRRQDVSFFFDQGSHDMFRLYAAAADSFRDLAEDAKQLRRPEAKELTRLAGAISLSAEIARESADLEVVSHECTHHMAAATGLFPKDSAVPLWVQEGLATYFEAPGEAIWAGVGAVSEERLEMYRQLASDPVHSALPFIVSDQIFMRAASNDGTLHAYGQAWALTHYLMTKRFDDLMRYYAKLAALNDYLQPEDSVRLFEQVFGPAADVQSDFRRYMREIRTDFESTVEQAKR